MKTSWHTTDTCPSAEVSPESSHLGTQRTMVPLLGTPQPLKQLGPQQTLARIAGQLFVQSLHLPEVAPRDPNQDDSDLRRGHSATLNNPLQHHLNSANGLLGDFVERTNSRPQPGTCKASRSSHPRWALPTCGPPPNTADRPLTSLASTTWESAAQFPLM